MRLDLDHARLVDVQLKVGAGAVLELLLGVGVHVQLARLVGLHDQVDRLADVDVDPFAVGLTASPEKVISMVLDSVDPAVGRRCRR